MSKPLAFLAQLQEKLAPIRAGADKAKRAVERAQRSLDRAQRSYEQKLQVLRGAEAFLESCGGEVEMAVPTNPTTADTTPTLRKEVENVLSQSARPMRVSEIRKSIQKAGKIKDPGRSSVSNVLGRLVTRYRVVQRVGRGKYQLARSEGNGLKKETPWLTPAITSTTGVPLF